jgi:hypothetical protein
MNCPVQSVLDRSVTVDRTGPYCGQICVRPVPYHGPVQRWAGPLHPKLDRVDPSRADPWTETDRAGSWTGP